jgi:hypothetical protein
MASAQSRRRRETAAFPAVERRRGFPSARWNGRPVPHVTRDSRQPIDTIRAIPASTWEPEEESPDVAAPLLPRTESSETSEPFSTRSKGRLLRLSEDGALTIYSLDDALRDLEVVSQTVHDRRIPRAEGAASSGRPPSI